MTTEQFPPNDYCRIPAYRNFLCPFYDDCLTVHAVRDSTGFSCDGCEHLQDRLDPHPHEVLAVVRLLAAVFEADLSVFEAALEHRPGIVAKREGCWVQPVGVVSA